MAGQDDLRASLEALMAAKRDKPGEPPTPEDLLAYRDGRLTAEQRRRVEQKIAGDPDAGRALQDLAAFPEVVPAPGTPELSDEEIGARWQAFRARLGELPPPLAAPVPPVALEPPREERAPALPSAPPASRRPATWRLPAAAALALAVGGAGGFLLGRADREAPASAVNVEIAELTPAEEGGSRASRTAVELPPGSEALVLVLGTRDHEGFSEYGAEIAAASGGQVWAREGLHPTPLGTFHLAFRQGVLQPGIYRIHLYGLEDGNRTPVAEYELQLAEAPGRER